MYQKSTFILIFSLGIFLNSCKKEEPATIPILSTSPVNNITAITAVSGGSITTDGDSKITSSGVCWSTRANPTTSETKTTENVKAGQFVSNLTGLSAGTTYHVRAYATNSVGTAYGSDLLFTTLGQTPSAVTLAASSVSPTGVTLNGTVNPNELSSTVTFEYGTTTSYGLSVNAVQSPVTGNSNVNVIADVSGLTIGTTYHFRIKAVNVMGTTYGSDMTFTTSGQAPTSQTLDATNVTGTTALLNGIVNANNLSTSVTFEFGTTTAYGNTVTASQSPLIGNTDANVSANITGLALGTSYHFRVRATNSLGTVYGNDVTLDTYNVPTITTAVPETSSITGNSAVSGGNITFSGGIAITARGVCWNTTGNPTISDNKTSDGSETGIFTSSISGLNPATTYHVRAYATNLVGTSYGEDVTFSTIGLTLPRVSTEPAYWIGFGHVQSGGNVISEGDSPVTSRGVCWSTNQNPTINDNKTIDGSGAGPFGSLLTDLMPYPQIFIRAYATNSAGTAYGEEMYLVCEPPSVVNLSASNITGEGAMLNAEVFSNDLLLPEVTVNIWNQDGYNQQVPYYGPGIGQITIAVNGLNLGTTYYFTVSVFSICGIGTVSESIEFTTLNTGTVSDVDGNTYKTIKIGNQIWMAENLRTTKYNDNSNIPNVANDATWGALTDDAYCWYENNNLYKPTYGALYNWYAVNSGKLCPSGWNVPSDSEWTVLTDFLGGLDIAGGKMKEVGLIHWLSPNVAASNASGFTALPGGVRDMMGVFQNLGTGGWWWSASSNSETQAWFRLLHKDWEYIRRSGEPMSDGMSVRCIKD